MELTLGEIVNIQSILMKLGDKKMDVIPAFKIARMQKKFAEEINNTESSRIEIVEKYCEKNEDGTSRIIDGVYCFSDNNREAVNKELLQLYNIVVQVDITKLTLNELSTVDLTPTEIQSLMKIIEE